MGRLRWNPWIEPAMDSNRDPCGFRPESEPESAGIRVDSDRNLKESAGQLRSILIRKNKHLVTLALVSFRQNKGSRAQTSIFTAENHHFLVQVAPQTSWPPSLPADCLQARSPQPGVLSQGSSARNPQPGILEGSLEGSCALPLRVPLRVPSRLP